MNAIATRPGSGSTGHPDAGIEDPRFDEDRSDAELLSRARQGDSVAMSALYVRHQASALRLARQLVDGVTADDVVSDAFIRVGLAVSRGGGPVDALAPYLLQTVRNVAIDTHRRRR